MPMRELLTTAAAGVGARPPRFGIPLGLMYAAGFVNGVVSRLLRRDPVIDVTGVRLLHTTSAADHGKAMRELGWKPRPAAESIRKAAQFHVDHSKEVSRRG
jgi:nucleoside-diphosphate-sugar epimerase